MAQFVKTPIWALIRADDSFLSYKMLDKWNGLRELALEVGVPPHAMSRPRLSHGQAGWRGAAWTGVVG